MKIERVPASHGWLWIKLGYRLITRSPFLSIVLAAIAAAIIFLAMSLPGLGLLLSILLLPVLMAGYMRACLAMEHSEEVELPYLFAGFKKHPAALVSLGGFLLMGLIVTSLAISLVGGEALATVLNDFKASEDAVGLITALQGAGSSVMLSLMVGFALVAVLMLALQYAPMLVFFNGMAPLAAIKLSLQGSFRNLVPFTVYSLIMQLVGAVASVIPFELGMLFVIPLGLTSMYTSYRDIFSSADETLVVIEDEENHTDDDSPGS